MGLIKEYLRGGLRMARRLIRRVSLWLDYLCGRIKKSKIVEASSEGEKVSIFKPQTLETVEMNRVYGFIESGSFTVEYPEIALWKFRNASVVGRTDYVFLKSGNVFWKKYFAYNYSKNIPLDRLFVKEQDGILFYKRPAKSIHVPVAFSLLGVHSQIWSHSLSEFFPKIAVLGDAIKDAKEKIAVLVPDYHDSQLRQVFYDELSKYPVQVIPVEDGVRVNVDVLYYMERPTTFTDHELSVEIGDDVQPEIIADYLKKVLVKPRIEHLQTNPKYSKLYLPRRGFGRQMDNEEQVEQFFREKGYYFLEEPHKLSLEEKVEVFYSADIIVGPFGSAFSNILFCRPNTKVLLFSNFSRTYEAWLCMHQMYFGIDALWVTGYDDKNASVLSHCSYTIPLNRIIAAATKLGILDE